MLPVGAEAASVTGDNNNLDELNTVGRVKILEHSFHKLESRMESGFSDLTKAVRTLSEALQSRPAPIPFKEIAATVAVCIGIIAYIGNFLEGQYQKNNRIIEYRLEQLEKRVPASPGVSGETKR